MVSLTERLDMAEAAIQKPSFRRNKGLGNEVGYYIFDYPAEDELKVRLWVEHIRSKYRIGINGFQIVVFDLYDIIIEILEKKGFLEKCYDKEKTKGMNQVIQSIGRTLRITATDSLIVSYIKERTPDNSVLFITGVGKCYPVLRSHVVLNNMHQSIDHVPVVMFYPGKYDGRQLILFGEIKDDNYYRAFKLVD